MPDDTGSYHNQMLTEPIHGYNLLVIRWRKPGKIQAVSVVNRLPHSQETSFLFYIKGMLSLGLKRPLTGGNVKDAGLL